MRCQKFCEIELLMIPRHCNCFRYGLIIPSKNKGARSGFLSSTSEPKRPNKVFAGDSSSDDNLEEDEEEEEEKPVLDWRSRAVAVI